MSHPKYKLLIGGLVLLLIVTFIVFLSQKKPNSQGVLSDYKNATYSIEGKDVTLIDGRAESEEAPGSSSKLVTQYFGNEVSGDLNNDGLGDYAFLLTQSGGGSGTFYYVVAALKKNNAYQGTNAVFLGDRIAPQTTELNDREITVNYADRLVGEPETADPTVGVSRHFKISGTQLVETTPRNTGDLDSHKDLIRLNSPTPSSQITSPLSVTGQARGGWFFEASFPVVLLDGNGKEIASFPAQTHSNWMTSEFIPFTATLTFVKPTTAVGTLILKKDNPSGLPEKEDFISIPVKF